MPVGKPFEIQVNGETIWKSEGDADTVRTVSLVTPRGEAGRVGLAPMDSVVNLLVEVVDVDSGSYPTIEADRARVERDTEREEVARKEASKSSSKSDLKPEPVPASKTTSKKNEPPPGSLGSSESDKGSSKQIVEEEKGFTPPS